jgi:hypothetical protein
VTKLIILLDKYDYLSYDNIKRCTPLPLYRGVILELFCHLNIQHTKVEIKPMKKAFILLLGMLPLFLGCATIQIAGKAELSPVAAGGKEIASKKCWYLFYGLLSIGNNSTSDIVPENSVVYFKAKTTFWDGVLNSLAWPILGLQVRSAIVYECPRRPSMHEQISPQYDHRETSTPPAQENKVKEQPKKQPLKPSGKTKDRK